MIPYSLLSQISLLIVAVALTFTYIKPTFIKIADVQDKTSTYQVEIKKVEAVNQRLDALVASVESVSTDDHKRLLTYMPNTVDIIAVPRDIQAIASDAGVIVRQITYDGPQQVEVMDDLDLPEPHAFLLEFEGSYEQVKNIVASFEQNHYPLEVLDMDIRKLEGGFLGVSMKLLTYDRTLPPVEVQPALQ
jgi:hypothetical protein